MTMTIHTNNSLLPSTKPGVKPPSHKSKAKLLPPFNANTKRQTPSERVLRNQEVFEPK